MKNILIILIAITGMVIVSCSDSFLDVEPKGKSFAENYYTNEDEVRAGLNAAYDFLVRDYAAGGAAEGHGYSSSFMMRCIASDNANAGGGNINDMADWQAIDEFRVTKQNGSLLQHWQRSYFGIYRCNQIIDREYEEPSDLMLRYIAEAKFLRAYYYWELVTFFGGVPIVDWRIDLADPYPARSSVEDVYTFIIGDLQDAIDGLPLKSEFPSSEHQRASKGAAQALLSKVYMFQEDYPNAIIMMEELFATSEYELDTTSYEHIFTLAGEFGVESIFEINYTKEHAVDWEANRSREIEGNTNSQLMGVRSLGPNSYYKAGWGFNKVEVDLINAFDNANDSIRKYNSAYGDEFFTANGISYSDPHKNTGWWCKKMAPDTESFTDGIGASELDYAHNEIVMRLADFYLLYAEAQYFAGSQDVARDYVNLVRTRVGLPDIPDTVTGQDLFDAIVLERRLELAMEGHRYFDLIRWGLAAQELQNQWGGSYDPSVHNLFPIPQQEINRSGGVLTQNPGY